MKGKTIRELINFAQNGPAIRNYPTKLKLPGTESILVDKFKDKTTGRYSVVYRTRTDEGDVVYGIEKGIDKDEMPKLNASPVSPDKIQSQWKSLTGRDLEIPSHRKFTPSSKSMQIKGIRKMGWIPGIPKLYTNDDTLSAVEEEARYRDNTEYKYQVPVQPASIMMRHGDRLAAHADHIYDSLSKIVGNKEGKVKLLGIDALVERTPGDAEEFKVYTKNMDDNKLLMKNLWNAAVEAPGMR